MNPTKRVISGHPETSVKETHETQPLSMRAHLRQNQRLYLAILALYVLLYLFIFRGILWNLPALMRGTMVLNTDELVPFFNIHTQLIDQMRGEFIDLTNGYEFRLRYAFLTTWMRYYKILPFAIIISNIISTFVSFVAVSLFLRLIVNKKIPEGVFIRSSALAVLFINLLLVYSKIIHFYTLIIGFNEFLISTILLLHGLFISKSRPYISLVLSSLLIILNPAVHFVVLYIGIVAFLCLLAVMLRRSFDKLEDGTMLSSPMFRRVIVTILITIFFVLIPYALFVKYFVLTGIADLRDITPVNYDMIRTSSLTFLQQISFDIGSVMDNFLIGRYTIPFTRFSKFFYFFLVLLPLFPAVRREILKSPKRIHALYFIIIALCGFSIWSALGYPKDNVIPTLHNVIASIANALYVSQGRIQNILLSGIATVSQVLRFPHRFQFITFASFAILMPLGIGQVEMKLRGLVRFIPRRLPNWFGPAAVALSFVVFFIPLFSNWEYRVALLSGDFGGYLSTYPTESLRGVKDVLIQLPPGKTIVVPPSETQKRIVDSNGVQHKFIDKFYIYYLDSPSYYYGLTGDLENKRLFYFFYTSLSAGQKWWVNALRSTNVRYVIVNKELRPNPILGVNEYLKNTETTLRDQISLMPSVFQKLFENDGFILYEMLSAPKMNSKEYLLDLDWNTYSCSQERFLQLHQSANFHMPNIQEPWNDDNGYVVTNDKEKAVLDLFTIRHSGQFFRPDDKSLAFNNDHVPSSRYFGIIFAMQTLLQNSPYNYFHMIIPGIFDTLTGAFIGLPQSTTIRFPVDVPQDGSFAVYLRGVATRNSLSVELSDHIITRSIDEKESGIKYVYSATLQDPVPSVVNTTNYTQLQLESLTPNTIIPISNNFQYFRIGTLEAKKGKQYLYLTKHDANPMLAEGVLLVNSLEEPLMSIPEPTTKFVPPKEVFP